MSDLPPRPANTVFRLRINGRLHREIGFNSLSEAEDAARDHVEAGERVEIIDGVTGRVVKSLQGR